MIDASNTLLCSGFYHAPGQSHDAGHWHHLWFENLRRNLRKLPRILVIANGGCVPPINSYIQKVFLTHNGGHVGDLLNNSKPDSYCGWSTVMLTGAMISFAEGLNFCYYEQDVLSSGDWLSQAVKDLGDAGAVFGQPLNGPVYMPVSQSLFLVRHSFIPEFIKAYLSFPNDRTAEWIPELKFHRMMEANPEQYRTLSFGVDRQRPIPYDSPVWYAQKFTPEELQELFRRKMI